MVGREWDMQALHGTHVAPSREGHAVIEWSRPVPRCGSIRVRSFTCDCAATVYELCSAAGLFHIRRTVRSPEGHRVSESPWLRVAEAIRLWDRLLDGSAR